MSWLDGHFHWNGIEGQRNILIRYIWTYRDHIEINKWMSIEQTPEVINLSLFYGYVERYDISYRCYHYPHISQYTFSLRMNSSGQRPSRLLKSCNATFLYAFRTICLNFHFHSCDFWAAQCTCNDCEWMNEPDMW